MINVPLGCNKFSMLQARRSRTRPHTRHEDLRSVPAEYRPRIASIRQRYGSLLFNDMIKDVERCLENHLSLEDRESSRAPTQLSQVREVYDTSPSQWDPGGIIEPHPGSSFEYAATIRIDTWGNQKLSGSLPGSTRARAYKDAEPRGHIITKFTLSIVCS